MLSSIGAPFVHEPRHTLQAPEQWSASGEQHVDSRISRQKRDSRDCAEINEWINDAPPFPKMNVLMSLSTGILGNSQVNCHHALDIGTTTMQNFIGSKFGDMKQSKKNVVL
ncbi:hypothetical protein JTB14_034877 [Gonioctena quinquepunctata]|nr:hypothetical protein JTB14_034877 [Gonioctena quinquepunctata]